MSQGQYHLRFQDSSDEEQNIQVAHVVPVTYSDTLSATHPFPFSNSNQQQEERSTSLFGWVINGVVGAIKSVFSGLNIIGGSEPISASRTSLETLSDSGMGNTCRGGLQLPSQTELTPQADSVALSEDVAVDLREVILQYRRTPYDVYMRIILAALNFGEVLINGDVFLAAAGNRELVKCLLHSGKVDVNDPVVQRVIQSEINSVIEANAAYSDRFDPNDIEYLALLCRVPSATLTKDQAWHCRRAGFEFNKILYENPHVLRDIPPPHWIMARILDFCYILNMVLTWFGVIIALLNFVCIAWFVYRWFTTNNTKFFMWTVICYLAGHVGSIVVGMLSEEGKICDYDDRLWNYPNNLLRVIPCIPVFAIALMYVTLRYELRRDKTKYFVIRHDLYNSLSNFLIIHTYFFATPQLLLQYYLGDFFNVEKDNIIAFRLLTTIHYVLFGTSIYLFLWRVLFQYSCNSFGFAVMTVKRALIMPIDVTTLVLIFTTYFLLNCNIMSSAIFISTFHNSSFNTTMFVVTVGGLTLVEIIVLTVLLLLNRSRLVWIVCVSVIALQLALIVNNSFFNRETNCTDCLAFPINASFISPFGNLAFAFMCVSFVAWVVVALHSRITGRQPFLRWDNFFYWSRGR